jgi:sensor histidine kinase regulating citrate/malate metabolism
VIVVVVWVVCVVHMFSVELRLRYCDCATLIWLALQKASMPAVNAKAAMLAAALFTSSPESIVAFDQNGLITAFNGAAERVCPAHPRPGSKQQAVSSG